MRGLRFLLVSHITLFSLYLSQWKSFESPAKDGNGKTVGLNAHGTLPSLGPYGGDCSLNWADGTSIGGGFNTGLTGKDKESIMGLGGGFNYNASMIDVGAGISAFDSKVNYHLSITSEGKVVITFDSTKTLKCVPSNDQKAFTCTT